MKLSVHVKTVRQDAAVVTVEGELDISTVGLLDAVLLQLPEKGIRRVVVAGDRLRFCDVCGFRVLASVHVILTAIGGRLVIAEPSPALRRVAYLLQQVLSCASDPPITVYATLAEAVRQEGGQPSPTVSGVL